MTVGRKCLFRPGSSDVDLLGYRKGVVNLDSEKRTVLSILVWPSGHES